MKPIKNIAIAIVSAGLLLITLNGCNTAGGLFHKTTSYAVPVTQNGTNTTLSFADYDSAIAAAHLIYSNTPPAQIPLHTNETFTVAPVVTRTVDAVGSVTSFIPPPYGSAVTAGLGLFGGLMAWIARQKTVAAGNALDGQQQALQDSLNAQTDANLKASILRAVVTGVELSGSATAKQSINNAAAAAGVHDDLQAIVDTHTAEMRKTGAVPIVLTPQAKA